MRFTQILAPAAGLFAAVNAWGETAVWTTVIETDYTTYCPSPTTFAWNNVTYTATSATTVTITNCPCTVTYSTPPVITTTSYPKPTYYPTGSVGTTITYPVGNGSSTVITYTPPVSTYISGTVPITTTPGVPTTPGLPTNTPIPPTTTGVIPIPTAAADKIAPIGALLAAGLAALAL
ncbi:hypothetical protein F4820DRAFT_435956 [Hypoxylon rubiginosum]|uniref:Uncharacterized protein n=1 Tax=Hypoxylon rubiginosum TaxID=110542 RepID=A0ACB9YNH9_9PEZI|nr:hypothetical protein F4820DRAFT_435956 [Hypoxylon rubiginosum]